MSEDLDNTSLSLINLSRDCSIAQDSRILASYLEETRDSSFSHRRNSATLHNTTPRKPQTNPNATCFQNSFRKLHRHSKPLTPKKLAGSGEKENIQIKKLEKKAEKVNLAKSANKQSSQIKSILDSTTEFQTDYYTESQKPQAKLEDVVVENKFIHARTKEYAEKTHGCSKSQGYDEFYVKTLIQQKEYFEKEVKVLIEVLSQKEAETSQLIKQFENEIAETVEECEHWKQKVTVLERRISENHFFETKRLEGFQLDLDLKNQEISKLKLEMKEKETASSLKLASLTAELDRLHCVANSRGVVIEQRRRNSEVLPNGNPQIYPFKSTDKARSLAVEWSQETHIGFGDQLLNESIEAQMNSKKPDFSLPGKGTRGHKIGKETGKAQVLNIMLMIEIDRLHSIIDQLGAMVDSNSPDCRVLRG